MYNCCILSVRSAIPPFYALMYIPVETNVFDAVFRFQCMRESGTTRLYSLSPWQCPTVFLAEERFAIKTKWSMTQAQGSHTMSVTADVLPPHPCSRRPTLRTWERERDRETLRESYWERGGGGGGGGVGAWWRRCYAHSNNANTPLATSP